VVKLGGHEVDLNPQSKDALIIGEQDVPSIATSVLAAFGESAAWIAIPDNED
jgi:hypothetical protein